MSSPPPWHTWCSLTTGLTILFFPISLLSLPEEEAQAQAAVPRGLPPLLGPQPQPTHPQIETLSPFPLVPFISLSSVLWGAVARKNWGRMPQLRDCPFSVLSSPGNEGLQLPGDTGGGSWPLAAGMAAHLGQGPGRELRCITCVCWGGNWACGHVPAPLELGDLGTGRAPEWGQAVAVPWRESPAPLKKKKELFSKSGACPSPQHPLLATPQSHTLATPPSHPEATSSWASLSLSLSPAGKGTP